VPVVPPGQVGHEPLDAAGEALWRQVVEAWDDRERHDRFVEHCFATMRLVVAAARYCARLVEQPEDATARQMSARIAMLAAQALRPTAPPQPPLSRSPIFLITIALAAAVGAVLGFFYRGRP
jgi:hypothetical protein